MLVRSVAPLVLCLLASCVAAAAQETAPGDVQNCTDAGVLAPDGVKLKQPAELVLATRTRDGRVEAGFEDSSKKSLVFRFGGLLAREGEFTVVHTCRIVDGDIRELKVEVLPKDSRGAKAIADFLKSWLAASYSEEKRVVFQGILRLSGDHFWTEFNKLTEAEKDAYWVCEVLHRAGRSVSDRGR